MKLKEQNILFFTRTMALGGTENVILQLCEILKDKVNKIIVCSCGGVNVSKLEDMGIKHYTINDIQNKNPKTIISTILKLKNIIKNENITIVHSHHRMAAFYANVVCNKKIIKIANAHNTFYDKKLFTKLSYKNTKLIAVGEKVKDNLTDYFGIESENVTVIHNAIKPFDGKITIDKQIKKLKKKGHTVIANVGRLSEQKGMEYYIEACKILKEEKCNAKYLIIGSGEDEEKLKNMVNDYGLKDDVLFFGFRSDVQNIFSQVDFVVLSSLWEGLPLTPIEAFSVGKTVIGTSVDGTPEIIKDDINGILIEPKNAKDIVKAITKLIDNKYRSKLEKNAKKTYDEEFSYDVLAEKYTNYYEKLK